MFNLSGTPEVSVSDSKRTVRVLIGILGGLVVLTIGVFLTINGLFAMRIRRIVDHGGMVRSWSPLMVEPVLWKLGYTVGGWFEDHYVIRDEYEVYLGDIERGYVSCGTGITFGDAPDDESLRHQDPGDEGPALVKELRGITKLSLAKTSVTDSGLAHLQEMPRLMYLILDETLVRGPGLVHLKGLGLTALFLNDTAIDDDGFSALPELPTLSILELGKTKITGKSLAPLHHFRNLKHLDLHGTQITDDDLKEIENLPIVSLNLHDTPLTDAAIVHLEALPKLGFVDLCGTRMTAEALRASSSLTLRETSDLHSGGKHHPAWAP